jgi:hypothetical protein
VLDDWEADLEDEEEGEAPQTRNSTTSKEKEKIKKYLVAICRDGFSLVKNTKSFFRNQMHTLRS